MSSMVKANEFFGQMQAANRSFRLLDSNVGADEDLMRGSFRKMTVRRGLTFHYSDLTNLRDLQTKTEAPPHLGIKLFFQGGIAARIGNLDIPMPVEQSGGSWVPSATLFHQREHEVFTRHAGAGDRTRKLTIKILPEWLESGDVFAGGEALSLQRFTEQKLAARSWTPSRALLALAEQMINPPVFEPHLARLYMESRVISVVAEAFGLLSEDSATGRNSLSLAECKRLKRAEDMLLDYKASPSIETVAAATGVSVNTLQRLFQAAHGTSVFSYIRDRRLDQARLALETEGLPIAQAAYIAGYTSPANFSTAFKRRYGFTPKQCRR
ncbi:AraC family transcriptional regulator [Neorhizobium sp. NCHU2750]|uniref:helix-turn-helix transcriptional regulator n=1 Tax=Neorhizobium sp. NCHU2750 TaxID=1825976 RepID=UPI000E7221E3|nr:transcriptional regulator [Neorhizobium sp. NCHU2750]